MCNRPIIVWLRRDLRLLDNPALYHASQQSNPILPVFIWAPEEHGRWSPGGAHKWWLHYSLAHLDEALKQLGANLLIQKGSSIRCLASLVSETDACAVYFNTRYEPSGRQIDADVSSHFRAKDVEVKSFSSHLLHDPELIRTASENPYQVFTPFWKKLKSTLQVPDTLPGPASFSLYKDFNDLRRLPLQGLGLLPKYNWATGLEQTWQPGQANALKRLEYFSTSLLRTYPTHRDLPATDGTSRLSPHLHFGELSPRQIWHTMTKNMNNEPSLNEAGDCYLREIGWREFAHHLLYHFPQTPLHNLKPAFDSFEWRIDEKALERWQQGKTGYPIVDAGMRQLWETGWMHNRVRMIVASFLTKHLLIPWQEGARWFWDTLVDGNLANNTLGWQWSAGSGADAQPFFRIFNPITQSQRFDKEGEYIKRWVPEVSSLPAKYVHTPWLLPENLQCKLNFTPGATYPLPVVDHKIARQRALDVYQKMQDKR